jgi:hypothetical protein
MVTVLLLRRFGGFLSGKTAALVSRPSVPVFGIWRYGIPMTVPSRRCRTVVYEAFFSLFLQDIGVLVKYGASKVIQLTRYDAVAWVMIIRIANQW